MKIGISVRSDWGTDEALSMAQTADQLGFDQVWTNGNVFSRDQFLLLSSIAQLTTRVELGTAIVEPFSRHPVSLAASAATLSSVTKRTINIGIGSSKDWIFESVGLDSSMPVSACCEAALLMKRLLKMERVSFEGKKFTLRETALGVSPRSEVRVLIGAEGPNFVKRAGEISDGLIFPLGPAKYNEQVTKTFFDSVKSNGRGTEGIEVVAILNTAVSDDAERAYDAIRGQLAETIAHMSPNGFKYLGIDRDEAEGYRKDPSHLPDEFVRDLAVCGTVDDCISKLRSLEKLGITGIYMHNASLYSKSTKEEVERRRKNVEDIGRNLIPAMKREFSSQSGQGRA